MYVQASDHIDPHTHVYVPGDQTTGLALDDWKEHDHPVTLGGGIEPVMLAGKRHTHRPLRPVTTEATLIILQPR